MKSILLSLIFFAIGIAQDSLKTEAKSSVIYRPEQRPKLITQVNPKYPKNAQQMGIEGRVMVQFDVDTNGNTINVIAVKSIPVLDQAAIEAVKQYKFTPGYQRGKKVKVRMMVPIRFKLAN